MITTNKTKKRCTIMKYFANKLLLMIFAVLFMSTVVQITSATIYPSYNTEQDCRGCHGSDVSDRHHFLVANGTFQCTDCHPVQYDNVTHTYSTQVIRNCLICHPGKNHNDIHHILVSQGLFVCSDCHPLVFDNVTQTYQPQVTWDCPACHSTVLSIQNVTPTPTPDPTPTPTPANVMITNFTPSSPVDNFVGDSRNFHIAVDQIATISWFINGGHVQTDDNVIESNYLNMSAALGIWIVNATASNVNGSVTYSWIWNVTTPPLPPVIPSIISYAPISSPVHNYDGSSRKFGIAIDQIADIRWLIDGNEIQSNGSVNAASFNASASIGTWNVTAIATNINGSVSHSWIWEVLPLIPPTIIYTDPISPVDDSTGSSRVFSATTDQIVDMDWLINGTPIQSDSNVMSSSYTNNSASVGTWNVTIIATNANGSASYSWIWNVFLGVGPTTIINPPNGQNDWYITDTIYLNATDSDGVKYTNYSVDGNIWNSNNGMLTPIILSDGIHSISFYSVDNLGNVEPIQTQSVKVDSTPPQIVINSPINGNYILNQNLIADWNTGDDTSGIAMETGTYPNGSVIDTTSPGTNDFTVTATDNAGNTDTKSVTYHVNYNFGQFLPPINNDGSSVFKLGSTVPIKFQLTDANGNYITDATAIINLDKIASTITGTILQPYSVGSGTAGNIFIYETNGNRYSYNLVTKGLSAGTWRITVTISDESSYAINVSLKK
jgi:hypothetical protein